MEISSVKDAGNKVNISIRWAEIVNISLAKLAKVNRMP